VTSALRRAPSGAVRRQDPRISVLKRTRRHQCIDRIQRGARDACRIPSKGVRLHVTSRTSFQCPPPDPGRPVTRSALIAHACAGRACDWSSSGCRMSGRRSSSGRRILTRWLSPTVLRTRTTRPCRFHLRMAGEGMKRGEIWTVAGGPDYAGKPRPAVILQDHAFDATRSVALCPLTSSDAEVSIRPPITPSSENGLRAPSRLMVD
jgi:PemK-like, MazF-like toxin of type II toxin-antitoxin system